MRDATTPNTPTLVAARPLTPTAYRELHRDGYPPGCRVCGGYLQPGDMIDPLHPWKHAGNIHRQCAAPPEVIVQ